MHYGINDSSIVNQQSKKNGDILECNNSLAKRELEGVGLLPSSFYQHNHQSMDRWSRCRDEINHIGPHE